MCKSNLTTQEKLELLHAAIHVYNQDQPKRQSSGNPSERKPTPTRKTIPEIYKELLSTIQED